MASVGKDICHDTLYKNHEAHEIFMYLNPLCQKRLIEVKLAYKGLRRLELIKIIEEQKKEVINLQENLTKVRKERNQLEEQNKKQALYILRSSNSKPME